MRGTASATAPPTKVTVPITTNQQPLPLHPTATWENCIPESVATYGTRVHVECTAAINGIKYFAVLTSNPKHTARILAVLLTAHAAGKPTSVLFDPADTTNLPPGCLVADCRLLLAVAIE